MNANITSDALSDSQIARHALALRRHHGLDDLAVPDVVALLDQPTILTRFGLKQFVHQAVEDTVLAGDEAVTLISPTHVRVRVSRTCHERARDQDRRARLTIAHEFMHGVLHRNEVPLARSPSGTGTRFVKAFVSVERQANVGASAYLITEAMVRRARSPADLAEIARVSLQAADIRWEHEQNRAARGQIQAGLKALSAELGARADPETRAARKLLCPACGEWSLVPIAGHYLCVGPCDRIIDGFADGDGPSS